MKKLLIILSLIVFNPSFAQDFALQGTLTEDKTYEMIYEVKLSDNVFEGYRAIMIASSNILAIRVDKANDDSYNWYIWNVEALVDSKRFFIGTAENKEGELEKVHIAINRSIDGDGTVEVSTFSRGDMAYLIK